MKGFISSLLWAMFTICAYSQPVHFSAIDAYAQSLPFYGERDLQRITDSLTNRYPTDLKKGRAVFAWITGHIAYDCGSENRLEAEPAETHPLYYTQQQVGNILRTRRTRCDGYSFLFKVMCRLAGVYATVQEGYARFAGGRVNAATVEPNHAWNAVCYDGTWYETDLTAAAGQCGGGQFYPMRREAFFQMDESLLKRLYIPIDDQRNSHNSGRIILRF
jgi:transglutaminase-like putative cysteine protease